MTVVKDGQALRGKQRGRGACHTQAYPHGLAHRGRSVAMAQGRHDTGDNAHEHSHERSHHMVDGYVRAHASHKRHEQVEERHDGLDANGAGQQQVQRVRREMKACIWC